MKSIDFGQYKGINGGVTISNVDKWALGTLPMPDTYYIGPLCRNNHGTNGKSIRYLKSKACVICNKDKHKVNENMKIHKKAMDIYEEQSNIDELDLMNMEL